MKRKTAKRLLRRLRRLLAGVDGGARRGHLRIQHYRASKPDCSPKPGALLPGELAIEMADPMRLWVGVPVEIHPDRQRLLLGAEKLVDTPPRPGPEARGTKNSRR